MFQCPHSHQTASEISGSSECSSNQQKLSSSKQLRHNHGMLLKPARVRAWTLWCPKSIGLQGALSTCKAWPTAVDGCSSTSWLPSTARRSSGCQPGQVSEGWHCCSCCVSPPGPAVGHGRARHCSAAAEGVLVTGAEQGLGDRVGSKSGSAPQSQMSARAGARWCQI